MARDRIVKLKPLPVQRHHWPSWLWFALAAGVIIVALTKL